MATKCVTYKAFKDYFTVCKPDPESAPEAKPKKAAPSKEKATYVPPSTVDYPKFGFSKYQ
jgi:hypothetical protein